MTVVLSAARQHKRRMRGTSLYVTRNWRLTFRNANQEIIDLDFEDYH
jgi:plasmid maintenance system killer protein